MKTLTTEAKVHIVGALVEGMGVRSVSRMTGHHQQTIFDLLLRVGEGCHFAYYNFVKRHSTIRMTPAMKARIVPSFWKVEDLIALAD
jgi:hypothetical protein